MIFNFGNSIIIRLSYGAIKAIQKNLDYLHFNPVESGEVAEPEYYLYRAAIDYAGGKGMLNIIFIE